jgi:hypothetical protein
MSSRDELLDALALIFVEAAVEAAFRELELLTNHSGATLAERSERGRASRADATRANNEGAPR